MPNRCGLRSRVLNASKIMAVSMHNQIPIALKALPTCAWLPRVKLARVIPRICIMVHREAPPPPLFLILLNVSFSSITKFTSTHTTLRGGVALQ